jgi:hypothetical protein
MAPNLDRHPIYKGRYIAYDARGFAFRVERYGRKDWRAFASHAGKESDSRFFRADTLRGIAAAIGASTGPA